MRCSSDHDWPSACSVEATGGAFMASTQGWGLPGLLDKPVSVRQQSVSAPARAARP